MNRRRYVAMLIAVVLLAALAGGYWWWRGRQQAAEEVRQALLAVDAELGSSPLDRSSLGALLVRLNHLPDADRDPQLIRARARIRMAQGRLVEAWDLESGLAEAVDAEAEDLVLGARILSLRHGLGGDRDDARRARSLAESHYGRTGQPASLLLAWQCSHRAGDVEEEGRLAARLVQEHPDSLEAELVQDWSDSFREGEPQRPTLQDLRNLEIRFDEVPLELDILLIVGLLEGGDPSDLGEAEERLKRLLEGYPAVVDVRHYAAVTAYLRGDVDTRNAHLDWLLEYAPRDPRSSRWAALRAIR